MNNKNSISTIVISKISSIFFILIMAVYPLFIGFHGYSYMVVKKALFFWSVTGIVIITLFSILIFVREKLSIEDFYIEDEPKRPITVAEWTLLLFIVWTLISTMVSVIQNPDWINHKFHGAVVWFGEDNRCEGFITFFYYAITFVIISRFYKIKRLHLSWMVVSTIIVSFIGILQFLGIDIFNLASFSVQADGIQPNGPLSYHFRTTLGNVNLVSSYCSFTVILFAALFTVARSRWKYLYLGACIFSFALSFTTGFSGDAHIVAILGSMLLLIPYWISNRERLGRILIVLSSWCTVYAIYSIYMSIKKRQYEEGVPFPQNDQRLLNTYTNKNTAVIITLAAILLAVGLILLFLVKRWNEKIMKIVGLILLGVIIAGSFIGIEIIGSQLSGQPDHIIWQAREIMHGRLSDDFGTTRGWVWRNAVEVIPDNPVFGTGPDTLFYALGMERQNESLAKYGFGFDKAHNVFLQITVCMGIPALIAYVVFLCGIFIPAIKQAFERPMLFVFGAAALSYVIQSFFAIEVPVTTPFLWIALGVMSSEIWKSKIGYTDIAV